MNRLNSHRFFFGFAVAATIAAPSWLGCSEKGGGTSDTPEAGPLPPGIDAGPLTPADSSTTDPDSSTACGKLPPTGLGQVIAPRTDGSELGQGAALTLDKKGRPIFAYLDHPASQSSTLYVVRWNDCTGAWYPPAKVDSAVPGDVGPAERGIAIATDATDGRIGIAYTKVVHLVSPPLANDTIAQFVALSSDDGATFTTARVSKHKAETNAAEGDINNVNSPAIALDGGKTFLAYNQTDQGCGNSCHDATVLATSGATGYSYAVVPDTSDTEHGGTLATRGFPVGLAIDSAGKPGVVAHLEPPTGYNSAAVYWRPGQVNYTLILDTNSMQNDVGAATLTYDGTKPRVVTRIQRGAIGAVTDYTLVFSASDDGVTWAAPVALPQTAHIQASEKILARNGAVVVLAGGPNVIRSANLTTFTQSDLAIGQGSVSVNGVFGSDGKLWVGFEGTSPIVPDALGGVVLYREP
jgi:hypothetical protein